MRPPRLVAQVPIGALVDSWIPDRKSGDGRVQLREPNFAAPQQKTRVFTAGPIDD
jgi:hypothetical protein